MQTDGAKGGAGHARVGNANHIGDARAQNLGRQAHIADLGHAGIALGPAVFQDHDASLVDIQRLVVDLGLVVVDVFEHHGAAPVLHQRRRGGRGFQHRALGHKIAFQHHDTTGLGQRLVGGQDHVRVVVDHILDLLPCGFTRYGQGVLMQQARLAQAFDDDGQAAGIKELFHQVFAGRHQVDDGRHVAAAAVPIFKGQVNADAAGDGQKVDNGIGRAADGGIGADGVFKRLFLQNVRRFQVVLDHLHDAPTGHLRHDAATGIHRRDGGIARQRHAQSLGH